MKMNIEDDIEDDEITEHSFREVRIITLNQSVILRSTYKQDDFDKLVSIGANLLHYAKEHDNQLN